MKFVATKTKRTLPAETRVSGQVGIGPIPAGFAITVALEVAVPGLSLAEARELVEQAHQVCPYSNATRGNVDVQLRVVEAA